MTAPTLPTTDERGGDRATEGRSRLELAAWLLLALASVWAVVGVLRYDFRETQVIGDQSSFVLQALSLAQDGHNLSYDQRDIDAWTALEWDRDPAGIFYQANDDGYAFAKPYGASIVYAAGAAVAGPRWGFPLAAVTMLLGSVGITIALLRLRLRGVLVPAITFAYVFASNLWWHAFVIMTELFLVCVVGSCLYAFLRGRRDHDIRWITLGAALAAFLLTEKAPLLPLLAPIGLVVLLSVPEWRRRVLVVAVAVVVGLVSTFPYLYYSDFEATNPYAGERYYALGRVHFDVDDEREVNGRPIDTDETFSATYVRENAFGDFDEKARAFARYFVGRYPGMIVFMPLAAFALAGTVVLACRRRLDAVAIALAAGAFGYILFYTWFFPGNFYGGLQSMGNRYWVQASPIVVALLAWVPFRSRTLFWFVGGSVLCSALFVPHFHAEPQNAYLLYQDRGPVQEVLPHLAAE